MDERDEPGVADEADAIDAWLADAAARDPYIDDAGFTLRVIGGLPEAADFALRGRILLGFAAAAVLAGLLLFGGGAFIWDAARDMVIARHFGPAQLGVGVFALVFYWSMYAVLRGRRD